MTQFINTLVGIFQSSGFARFGEPGGWLYAIMICVGCFLLYLAIVKADRGAKGKLNFSVESDGLGTAEMVFQIEKGKIRQYQYIP